VELSLHCHGFNSSMVPFWLLIEFIWKFCHHKINFAQIIIFSKGMVIIYNILEKLNCTSYILTSIKFIIQLKFYIILIIYINFLAFYRKKIQTCLRPPRTYWSSSATAHNVTCLLAQSIFAYNCHVHIADLKGAYYALLNGKFKVCTPPSNLLGFKIVATGKNAN
jgi:small-conductance mechanosensitive channel